LDLVQLDELDLYIEEFNKDMQMYTRTYSNIDNLPTDVLINIDNNDNKIKKLEDGTVQLIRFDTIDSVRKFTHDNVSGKSFDDIKSEILSKLDYELEYADDRVELVHRLINENDWMYDLVSSKKHMKNNIKTRNSFLSEDTSYGKLIDVISSYLIHPKFRNKDDEKEFNNTLSKSKEEKNEIREKLCDSTMRNNGRRYKRFYRII
jgi:hypothetical protein